MNPISETLTIDLSRNVAETSKTMPDPGQVVAEFIEASKRRAELDRSAEQSLETVLKSAQRDFERTAAQLKESQRSAETAASADFAQRIDALKKSLQEKADRLASTRDAAVKRIRSDLASRIVAEEKKRDEAVWHASTSSDSSQASLESQFLHQLRQYKDSETRLNAIRTDWTRRGVIWPSDEDADAEPDVADSEIPQILIDLVPPPPTDELNGSMHDLASVDRRLTNFWPKKLFSPPMAGIWVAAAVGLAFAASLPILPTALIAAVAAIGGHFLSRKRFETLALRAVDQWEMTRSKLDRFGEQTDRWYDESKRFVERRLDEQKDEASTKARFEILHAEEFAEAELTKTQSEFERTDAILKTKADALAFEISKEHETRLSELRNDHALALQANQEKYDRSRSVALDAHQARREASRNEWANAAGRTSDVLEHWKEWEMRFAPSWDRLADEPLLASQSGALRLGSASVALRDVAAFDTLDQFDHAIIPDLSEIPVSRRLPGGKSTLWIQGPPGRRGELNAMLQTIAVRALASFPPGQVRFTLVDPVGLGQTFAGLLHLADFEPALVNQRPWSEARDIEARLVELTMHLEFVVQNYLRNQYATIEDYNRDAGEVAEAYRLLFIADWPNGISDDSARRLRRLIEAGARCGIYVVVGHDLSQPGPIDISAPELRPQIDRIVWSADKNRWSWPAHPLDDRDLHWDTPPDPASMTSLVRRFGEAARKAMRVEVPFSVVAPPDSEVWSRSSAHSLDIPLGRSGARQLQSLRLGEGTSQHLLLAGRTGSGKSTLLHAVVTNAALLYSPEELELYLIDFKKGVEFKNYATRDLPHAQVVAVESEREFGLSVLERLDRELTHRGDLFRQAGVQDVAAFRRVRPDSPLPRVLLVVDEFQELFNEDDRLAADAASLLDRLVRQGRAFGVHVVLGSQSMAGAYAIARSTLGQMGVRIALQCNENDSRLILSEDNPAARMLSRPGEAIYNDANGMPEGNHLFQAVWISDQDREKQLARIHATAESRGWRRSRPLIVFEGAAAGDLQRHPTLAPALIDPKAAESLAAEGVPTFWPGESVTISDPPPVRFENQPASNMLVVGRQTQDIRSMLAAGVLGMAMTSPKARFWIAESPNSGETGLGALLEGLGDRIRTIQSKSLKADLGALRETLHARQDTPGIEAEPIFLILSDLARLRDLRKSDDDFGFGGFGAGESETPSPTKMLAEVLRDGAAVGIHTILCTDSSVTFGHATDRSALNEFGTLIIFQTTPAESTHFLDNVSATRLDRTQALLVRPSEGESIKIRPYALVENETWIRWLRAVR